MRCIFDTLWKRLRAMLRITAVRQAVGMRYQPQECEAGDVCARVRQNTSEL